MCICVISHVRLAGQPLSAYLSVHPSCVAKTLTLDIVRRLSNQTLLYQLVGIIVLCHFVSLAVALLLAEGQKVSKKVVVFKSKH